jgi:hypothetical protein
LTNTRSAGLLVASTKPGQHTELVPQRQILARRMFHGRLG